MLTFAKLSVICWLFYGGMAELVDALDSKSCFLWKYEFKSHHPYHFEKTGFYPVFFVAGKHLHAALHMPRFMPVIRTAGHNTDRTSSIAACTRHPHRRPLQQPLLIYCRLRLSSAPPATHQPYLIYRRLKLSAFPAVL